jgi:hypothetical protein
MLTAPAKYYFDVIAFCCWLDGLCDGNSHKASLGFPRRRHPESFAGGCGVPAEYWTFHNSGFSSYPDRKLVGEVVRRLLVSI